MTYDFIHFLQQLKDIAVIPDLRLGGYFSDHEHPNQDSEEELRFRYPYAGRSKTGKIVLSCALNYVVRGEKTDNPRNVHNDTKKNVPNEFWQEVTWDLLSKSGIGRLHQR